MRVYIAARFARREEMRQVVIALEARGIEVTSRWLKTNQDYSDPRSAERYASESVTFARHDLEDIDRADALIAFTDPADVDDPNAARGGRHVELGYAYAKRKAVAVVGYRENIFHHLPGIKLCANLKELGRWLDIVSEEVAVRQKPLANFAGWSKTVERVHG